MRGTNEEYPGHPRQEPVRATPDNCGHGRGCAFYSRGRGGRGAFSLFPHQAELTGLRLDHVPALAQFADTTDPELSVVAAVRAWGPERFVSNSRAEFALGMSIRLAVECDGRFAGYVALGQLRGGPAQLEFGIVTEYRGRGLAGAAAREILRIAGLRGVEVVESYVRDGNALSIAVLRRAGFTMANALRPPANGAIWRWRGGIDGIQV